MKEKRGGERKEGIDFKRECTILLNERGKTMTPKQKIDYQKGGKNYFGVKSVIRRGRQVVEGKVLVDLEGFNGRTYRFAISVDQLKQLLVGGKSNGHD